MDNRGDQGEHPPSIRGAGNASPSGVGRVYMHDDLRSFERRTDFTRRRFVVTTLAAGFALAVRPVRGETTIMTDAQGLEAGEVKIPVADGEIPAYRARPHAAKKAPVVLVVQEIFGVHEHIRDVCRRLAKLGYLAIAPELYARQGDVSKISDIQEIMSRVVSKVPDRQVMSDLDATAAWAGRSAEGDATRLGITGFCWGGRIVWLYAAHNPQLKAGVAWYGRLVGQPTDLQPKYPIDVVGDLKAPVLGLYGGQDQGIPIADVEKMRAALAAAKKDSEIVVFPEAPHGFHADYRPSYRAEDAAEGWRQCLAWFRKHGAG
jgi:carboxymethylenebutenolidase